MEDNWIELRALQERSLRQRAPEVWESIQTAIDDCCTSFNRHYRRIARARSTVPGRGWVVVEIAFPVNQQCRVSIEFSELAKTVTCTVDRQRSFVFNILADENHAYIQYLDKEISADELTEIALEKVFFCP